MINRADSVNNLDDMNLCELIGNCKIRELVCRVGSAVAFFFSFVIIKIYECLVLLCQGIDYLISCCWRDQERELGALQLNPLESDHLFSALFGARALDNNNNVAWDALEKDAPAIPTAPIKENKPTPQVARERRKAALAVVANGKAKKVKFSCPMEILAFNLDAATKKYGIDQPPTKLLRWYDYAKLDRGERRDLEAVLDNFTRLEYVSPEKYRLVRNLVSKLHYILEEKRTRIENLKGELKSNGKKALEKEIEHIFSKLNDASSNCIDQTLSQLEDLIIEVIASENPLGKDNTLSFLQYSAAHALFRYRANLIKEILVKDPALKSAIHMADIEREVKKKIASMMGMQGDILDAGAAFGSDSVTRQAQEAAERVAELFFTQYKPAEYLQEGCRVIWGPTKALRNDLMQWATTYYDLEGNDDTLAKAVVKSHEELEEMASVAAVELNEAGIQCFLEAAGIFVRDY
jgi:hypothetical protein